MIRRETILDQTIYSLLAYQVGCSTTQCAYVLYEKLTITHTSIIL